MNYLKLYGVSLSFIFCCTITVAQDRVVLREPDLNKPTLFDNFPDKIPVEISELQNMFVHTAAKGKDVNLKLANKNLAAFNGRVVSDVTKYKNKLRSVVVRSTNFNGATLSLSSSTTADGTVRYVGRIVSFQHGDLFVLQKENDAYFFIKKKYHDLINE